MNPSGKPGEVVSGAGEVFESNSSPNTPLLTAIDPAGAGRGGRPGLLPPAPAQVDPVFRRLGEPTPVRPFPRGANQERRFAGVTTRELNEAALLADPVVLAMSPADGRVDLLPEEIDKHTKAARRMVLDTKALDAIAEGRAGRMKVPLPDGTAVDLVFHRVRDRGGMTRTLEGEVEGEPQKTVAQFVYHDGIVHGSVARYDVDRHFEYRILSTGFLMVTELDLESMTDNCGGSPPPPAADIVHAAEGPDGEESAGEEDGDGDGNDSSSDTSGFVTMDIVVGYDAGARVADGGVSQIEARIISSVDRMNLAFSNSAITQTEIMLLGVIEDPNYVFPGGGIR